MIETTQSHPYLEPCPQTNKIPPSSLTQREWLRIWPLSYQMTSPPYKPSIYGQEGWWVGNPCEWASGVRYQSCYPWGETGAAVETPWCQRHAGYSFASRLGLDALRVRERGQRWWKVMFTCALATTLGPHPPSKTTTTTRRLRASPEVNWRTDDASQSSAATTVNVNIWKVLKRRFCFWVWTCVCVHIHHVAVCRCFAQCPLKCVDEVWSCQNRGSDVYSKITSI